MLLYVTNRMADIIKILSSTDQFISSKDLAAKFGVSSRTIREDIRLINDKIEKYQTQIISKKSKGYKIYSHSNEQLKVLLDTVEAEVLSIDDNFVTSDDRVRFIIKRILYSDESIKLQSLGDDLFVSVATIKNDLKKVKGILNKYNIQVTKTNNGIHAKGNEINKRFCISDYFIYNEEINHTFIIQLVNSFGYEFSEKAIDQIKEIILIELNKNEIEITDVTLNKIAIHILISIGRIKSGQPISSTQNMDYLKGEREYKIAANINKRIELVYNIQFSEHEIAYTTLHLVGNRLEQKHYVLFPNMKLYLGEENFQLSVDIVERTKIALKGLNLDEDEELIYSLGLHLKQLVTRLRYDMNIRNPLVNTIKIKYPLAFEAGVIAAQFVEKETGIQVHENEIGFLALHFGTAIERQRIKTITKKKVALVCASGMATSELLLTKLSYVLDHSYNLIGAYAFHQIDELLKQKPDLILTTVPIMKELEIPVIQIPSILNDKDVTTIQSSLERIQNKNKIIRQFFKKELFFPDLTTNSKDKTLNYLTDAMIHKGYMNTDIKDLIKERERISPTSIGNMVAIPHPLNMQSNQSFICTAILDEPVKWSSNEEVKLVIIIVLERKWQSKFQEIFESLYDIIQSPDIVQNITKLQSFDKFIEYIDSI